MGSDTDKCNIPSMTLGPCDLPRGHEDEMHASIGDGFYARCFACKQNLKPGDWHRIECESCFVYVCGACLVWVS